LTSSTFIRTESLLKTAPVESNWGCQIYRQLRYQRARGAQNKMRIV